MKRLFIVRTPLQLFNAIEAKERFFQENIKNELLIVYGSEKDLEIIKVMLGEQSGWDRIIYQKFYGLSKKTYAWNLRKYFIEKDYLDIFTGMIYHIPLHLMNTLNSKNNWLLDDGNETRLIIKNLNEGIYYQTNRSKKILGINQNVQILKKLKIFTLYDDLSTKHEIIKNDYRVFRSKVRSLAIRKSTSLLIGSNLIGTYILSAEKYLEFLKKFKERNSSVEIWYAPHRYLPKHLLQDIEEIGYKIFSYDTILELAQVQQGWCFEEYTSVRSTAIDTLEVLYGIQGKYISLGQEYFVSIDKWEECMQIWKATNRIIKL